MGIFVHFMMFVQFPCIMTTQMMMQPCDCAHEQFHCFLVQDKTVRSQCLYEVFSFENNWIILCTSILWSFWQKECYRSVFSDLNLISLSLNLCGCWCQVARKDHGGWGEDVGALLWRRDHQEEVVDRVVHSERWLNQTRTAPFRKPAKVPSFRKSLTVLMRPSI